MAGTSQPTVTLDKAAFKQVVQLPALRIPAQKCHELMRKLRGFTFDKPKTKCIVHDGEQQQMRLLLLQQNLLPEGLPADLQQAVAGYEWDRYDMHLDYSHLPADAVLKKLLPPDVEVPSSFEQVGHIAHLNLKEELLPYKHIIGQVILDKNPILKTVINKVGTIENEFRVFQLEVLAGEANFETEVAQHRAHFRLDYSQVYWNSRLETEHIRLVGVFKADEVVVDVMAGVGPFAIPAALKGCKVYANDLNPASAKYLRTNIHLNKVNSNALPFNMDGRQFVRLLLDTPGGPAAEVRAALASSSSSSSSRNGGQQAEGQPPTAAAAAAAGQQQLDHKQGQDPEEAVRHGGAAAGPTGAEAKNGGTQQQQQRQQRAKQQQKKKLPLEVPPPYPISFCPPVGGLLFQHVVMNLPASAVEFLDAFNGSFDLKTWSGQLPWVHVYTFMKNESESDVIKRVEAALGGSLDRPPSIHHVRDVAPNKIMLCVSFRVPESVAFAGRSTEQQQQQQQQQDNQKGQPAKKQRTDGS